VGSAALQSRVPGKPAFGLLGWKSRGPYLPSGFAARGSGEGAKKRLRAVPLSAAAALHPGSGPRSEGSLLRRKFMGTIGMLRSARPKAGALHSEAVTFLPWRKSIARFVIPSEARDLPFSCFLHVVEGARESRSLASLGMTKLLERAEDQEPAGRQKSHKLSA
jgi:hypothetical protein